MRILRRLFLPFIVIWVAIIRPFQIRARKRVLKKNGWVELYLEGEVDELRPTEPFAQIIAKRLMQREDPPRIVLSRVRRFARELASDKFARGVLVRIDALKCGLASAEALRRELQNIRDAQKEVVVHLTRNAGNLEMLVASAASKIYATPVGTVASVGAASVGLFMAETLERAGVEIDVVSRGRFKSAPDRFTRTSRSEADLEQTQALIDEMDKEYVDALAHGRRVPEADAIAMIDACPLLGDKAVEAGIIDGLARDEDLPETIQSLEDADEPTKFIGAGSYLDTRTIPPLFPRRRKKVGIVNVHGAILDKAPPYQQLSGGAAVEKPVINDLRAALNDKSIGAVVLHVNSRGGSVTASDAMYSAIKRLDREKPVIAYFGDVAASGGYYVGCGARSIVCDPLTITGSIGVFAMLPTWRKLAERVDLRHDELKNREHAALFNPYRGLDEAHREPMDANVGGMYERFLQIVADARNMSRDDAHELAQGRVWSGRSARENRLVDGLGGIEEAIGRAIEAGEGHFDEIPVLVRAKGTVQRPPPFVPAEAARIAAQWMGGDVLIEEVIAMLATGNRQTVWAYAPIQF